jgi:ribosome modulation factor
MQTPDYDPAISAFEQGRRDRKAGKTDKACPYDNPRNRDRWADGWLEQDAREINQRINQREAAAIDEHERANPPPPPFARFGIEA